MPSVCIMIPTYNQSKYISLGIESALRQDYTNISVVIADDCSTDDTKEVVQKYLADSRVKYWRNDRNLGRLANYRNLLYNLTSADWVVNLDGDDYYTNPSFVSNAIKRIVKEGTAENVLFYQAAHIVKFPDKLEYPKYCFSGEEIILTGSVYVFGPVSRQNFSHMSIIYNRKKAIESGFYEMNISSADIYSIYKSCINNPNDTVIVAKEISGIWVKHGQNISSNLRFFDQFKNYGLYVNLSLLAIKKGIGITKVAGWLFNRTMSYWKGYASKLMQRRRVQQ